MAQELDRADELLRERFAVAQPGVRHETLRQRPPVFPGDFGFALPVLPGQSERGGVLFVDGPVDVARLRLDADAGRADDVVDQDAQGSPAQVMVAFKVACVGTQRDGTGADKRVRAAVVGAALPLFGLFGTFVIGQHLAGLSTLDAGHGVVPGNDAVDDVQAAQLRSPKVATE